MTDQQAARWQQRFENYQKALTVLERAATATRSAPDDELYAIALIQSFKFTWELAWKVMKDYLTYQGVDCSPTPRSVIKSAYQHGLVEDGQNWIDMLQDRNQMSHVYDLDKAQRVIETIRDRYLASMQSLKDYLVEAE